MTKEIKYYNEVDAVNHSLLKYIDISLKSFFWHKENKQKETDAMIFGTLIHCLILEKEKFDDRYIIIPDLDKRTKAYKDIIEQHKDKIVVKQEDFELAKMMCDNVLNKKCFNLLTSDLVEYETELYWRDDLTGLDCKGIADIFIPPNSKFKNGMVVDIKTISSMNKFSLYNYSYLTQAAFYCKGLKIIRDLKDYPAFCFIVIEKEAPYDCKFYILQKKDIELGIKINTNRLKKLKLALEKNIFCGYDDKFEEISLKPWEIKEINKLLEIE